MSLKKQLTIMLIIYVIVGALTHVMYQVGPGDLAKAIEQHIWDFRNQVKDLED